MNMFQVGPQEEGLKMDWIISCHLWTSSDISAGCGTQMVPCLQTTGNTHSFRMELSLNPLEINRRLIRLTLSRLLALYQPRICYTQDEEK